MRARLALALLLVALPIATWFAVAVGMAAWHARIVQDYLVAASRSDVRFDARGHGAVETSMQRALAWRPHDGALLELDARLALLQATQGSDSPAAREKALDRAERSARAAITRRPRWPYAWLNVVAVRAAQGRRDADWAQAVQQAARWGPNETRVHAALAREYLVTAAREDARVAAVLATAFARSLQRQPQAWVDAADRAGLGAEVCARAGLPPPARTRCTDLGWLTPPAAAR